MDLILWRHAEAKDGSRNDLARALTSRGHKQAKAMATWLNARLPVVCRVVSSPAVRAQQTAEALMREVHTAGWASAGLGCAGGRASRFSWIAVDPKRCRVVVFEPE